MPGTATLKISMLMSAMPNRVIPTAIRMTVMPVKAMPRTSMLTGVMLKMDMVTVSIRKKVMHLIIMMRAVGMADLLKMDIRRKNSRKRIMLVLISLREIMKMLRGRLSLRTGQMN